MEKVFAVNKREYNSVRSNINTETLCLLEDFTEYSTEKYNHALMLLKLFNKCVEIWNLNHNVKEAYTVEVLDAYESISQIFTTTISTGKDTPKVSLEKFLRKYIEIHYPEMDNSKRLQDLLIEIANKPVPKKKK